MDVDVADAPADLWEDLEVNVSRGCVRGVSTRVVLLVPLLEVVVGTVYVPRRLPAVTRLLLLR